MFCIRDSKQFVWNIWYDYGMKNNVSLVDIELYLGSKVGEKVILPPELWTVNWSSGHSLGIICVKMCGV